MPAIEEIAAADPQELGRCLRDLVALSMLPATWINYDARQVAESATEVLVRMVDLEFAYMWLRPGGDRPEVEVARTAARSGPDPTATIRGALAAWFGNLPPTDVVVLANPLGTEPVRAVFVPVAAGAGALIVAASRRPEFPTAAQRLLLGVAANQAAIAIRRYHAEDALQRLNETLEQRVAAEIAERIRLEEAFRQTQKMEAIGRLTGGIAHDFNNLLTAVLGNLKLLGKRLDGDPAALHLIEGAIEGAERGAALTQRLLAFARRQDLKPAAIDAAELVSGMIEMLRRSIGPMIQVETDFAPDLWPAQVDANQLELALLNLAVNARDAMPDGGTLRLRARNETIGGSGNGALAAGDYVCLAVTDTGTGMDGATLARATEPFFTTKGVGLGTGLGLSMVHGMAAQSGGALLLSSEAGVGTTAEIWLPRADGGHRAATTSTMAVAPAETARACTILVVDDDALIRMATSEMLRDLGHQVVEAASGAKALAILHDGAAVDVVMTDQAMPGMTGTQLAALIRASWPDLPIMLATGYAELPDGADPALPRLDKPYGQEDLAAAVAQLMRARATQAS